MDKKWLLLILHSFVFSFVLLGQGQANNWYFGTNAGITFNTTPPSAITDGMVSTGEGCAVMSDHNGNLLFYTDGINVWDRNHQLMPNGNGLLGHPSAAQSGIIVPKPGSTTNYIIITVPETGSVGMCYSEVDLSLNGGMGDVLVSNKNTLMFAPSSEKVTVVNHANGLYYWVIGRYNATSGAYNSKTYVAYLINCDGIDVDNPVISQVGITDAQNWGYLVASPDGSKLASASSSSGIEIADFDNTNGQVSNTISLGTLNYNGTTGGNYGVAFSPNNKVLYASSITNWALAQWDLTAGNIPATQTYIGDLEGSGASRPSYRGGALQLGPDGKIYVCQTGQPYLGVINNPNTLGTGCNLVNHAINLSGKTCRLGLPPFIQSLFNTDSPTISYQNQCFGDNTLFEINGATYLDSVKWNFNDAGSSQNMSTLLNPSHLFSSAGNYNVQLIRYLDCTADTIYQNVTIHPIDTTYISITLCENGTYELPDHQVVSQTGTYTSTVQNSTTGCDSTIITQLIASNLNFSAGNDVGICKGSSTQLQASDALNYTWSPAEGLSSTTEQHPNASPTTTTTYTVSSQVQIGNNLVTNGDFEAGNNDFSTAYVYHDGNTLGPGSISVGTTNAGKSWWANCGDHTSGSGNMLIVDGADGISNGTPIGVQIWCQTIHVAPNTDYAFSTWFTNVNNNLGGNYPEDTELAFYINGTQLGNTQVIASNFDICQWRQLYEIWNSGSNSTIEICIREIGGGGNGNDFALDDISFYQICTFTDDVTVYVSDIELTSLTENATCYNTATGSSTVQATGGLGDYSYSWDSGQTTPTISQITSGVYTITVTDSLGCQKDHSVTISQPNALIATATSNNVIECSNNNTGSATVTIQGGTPNYAIVWDNQETNVTANALSPGNHSVQITDAHNCTAEADVFINHTEPPTVTISAENICDGKETQITTYAQINTPDTINTYEWIFTQNGQTVSTSNQSHPAIPLSAPGNYTASLTVTASNDCQASVSTNFEVYPNPTASIEQFSECFQTVEFTAHAESSNNASMTYQWDIDQNGTIESTEKEYTHYFTSSNPVNVKLIVTDSKGCQVEVSEPIELVEGRADIIFPNVLSMKSTVGNNQFDLEKIMPNFNSCVNYTLTILNRWGLVVFEVKNDKNNPDLTCSDCFKGYDQSGVRLSSGTYFYQLKGDFGIDKNGFLTIIGD